MKKGVLTVGVVLCASLSVALADGGAAGTHDLRLERHPAE